MRMYNSLILSVILLEIRVKRRICFLCVFGGDEISFAQNIVSSFSHTHYAPSISLHIEMFDDYSSRRYTGINRSTPFLPGEVPVIFTSKNIPFHNPGKESPAIFDHHCRKIVSSFILSSAVETACWWGLRVWKDAPSFSFQPPFSCYVIPNTVYTVCYVIPFSERKQACGWDWNEWKWFHL